MRFHQFRYLNSELVTPEAPCGVATNFYGGHITIFFRV